MKRLLTSALAAAMVVAGTGGEAQAQDRAFPLFEIGVYGGGAFTSDWVRFTDENPVTVGGEELDGFGIGTTPAFGLITTFNFSPAMGIRFHGGFIPSDFPEDHDVPMGDQANWALNNWLYDLSLVFRPFVARGPGLMGSTYFFLGGGGWTTNVAGDGGAGTDGIVCVAGYAPYGTCLSYQPSYASVGQATGGLGFDLFALTPMIGLFGEIGAHVYDSPMHVAPNNARVEDNDFAVTTRGVLGLKVGFGDIMPAPVVVAPPVAPAPPPPAPPAEERIRVCIVEGTTLREVEAIYTPAQGDTVVMVDGQRRPFAEAYRPVEPNYAAGATWFVNNEPVMVSNRRFVKYGLPRVVAPADLRHVGTVNGVNIFAAGDAGENPEVVYVPVRPGCEFQPYQYEVPVRRVRG